VFVGVIVGVGVFVGVIVGVGVTVHEGGETQALPPEIPENG
jgi:hypothetical protein